MSEYNRKVGERFRTEQKPRRAGELSKAKERTATKEYHVVNEKTDGTVRKTPRKKRRFSVASAFVAVAATVVIGVTTILPVGKTEISAFGVVTDTSAVYDLTIDGAKDADYRIIVSNDRYRSEIAASAGKNTIELTDLKPDREYNLEVKSDSGLGYQTVWDQKFYTKKSALITRLFEVSYQCRCNFDGKFYFKLDFQDAEQNWSEFSASLSNGAGVNAAFEWTQDPHGWQTLDVSAMPGGEYELKITAVDSFGGVENERVLYLKTVEI